MKKLFAAFIFSLFTLLSSYSQVQTLTPKSIYVGDEVQLQLSFDSQVDLFALPGVQVTNLDLVILDTSLPEFDSVKNDCTINSAILTRKGITYSVIIHFVPWKTGRIRFPKVDLVDLCRGSEYLKLHPEAREMEDFVVTFDSVKVNSLSSELNITSLRQPFAPLSLPGTNYMVWAIVVGIFLLMMLTALFLVKLPRIIGRIHLIHKNLSFAKNIFLTRIRFFILLHKKITDAEFAAAWQKIMRHYFTKRFRISFISVTSSSIAQTVLRCISSADEKKARASSLVAEIFLRTDYIRFASGSIDSRLFPAEEHEASFLPGETKKIIRDSVKLMKIFEVRSDYSNDSV
ncbi:hypothetical protein [Treponema sp.]|uniref:hypothetical protein n=1 Tax=Treponema sp. TaxID=166 RepID=UPI0025CF18EC|nr:hypothetical protein [Treponema sp.]MCR5219073.1 hypothetical protein [Treponema sp.]